MLNKCRISLYGRYQNMNFKTHSQQNIWPDYNMSFISNPVDYESSRFMSACVFYKNPIT